MAYSALDMPFGPLRATPPHLRYAVKNGILTKPTLQGPTISKERD